MFIKKMKKGVLGLAMLSGLAASATASAQVGIVFDPDNFAVNSHNAAVNTSNMETNIVNTMVNTENAATNTATLAVLAFIKHALTEREEGNMLDLTWDIHDNIVNIDDSINNIEDLTVSIESYTKLNYEINQDFTWITNNYYGDDEQLCPPDALPDECEIIIGRANKNLAKLIGKGVVDGYTANYKDAASYGTSIADKSNLTNVGFTAAANQKLANDALAQALSDQRGSLMAQAAGMTKLIDGSMKAEGHGNQLQYANALAGAQAVQLAEMRSLMLASESSRAAAAQAAADKEARHAASKQSLRRGLEQASNAGGAGKSDPRY